MYKLSKPYYSHLQKCELVDILKRKKLLFFFGYWSHHDTLLNLGQAEEIVFLLNNPHVFKERLNKYLKNTS
jgi:hypothetical protein